MKFLAFFAVFFLSVNLSVQIPQFVNCTDDFIRSYSSQDECGVVTCDGPGKFSGKLCPLYICSEDKYLGYKEDDNSKPFPQCCGGPICAP